MGPLAESGATWGISGPAFLLLYAVLAAASLGAVVILRRRAITAASSRSRHAYGDSARLSHAETAYLSGGRSLAVTASLATLHATRSIGTSGRRSLNVTGPPPAEATTLDRAIHQALSDGASRSTLPRRRAVARALNDVERGLEHRGLLTSSDARRRARHAVWWVLPVLALGVARVVDGLNNDRPIGYLLALMVVTAVLGLVLGLRAVPSQTPAGSRALERLREENQHLHPQRSPSLATYGAAGVAVGLFGAAALWQYDPGFASATGLAAPGAAAAAGGGASGYGSSGSGGGGGCGGGGGGGGCGGGCGG